MMYLVTAIIHTVIGFGFGVWFCTRQIEKALREGKEEAENERL